MKLAANLSLMFTELPLMKRFEAAARAGFRGVELLMTEGVAAHDLANAARDADVQVVLFNNEMGDLLNGGPGISGVPGRQSEFHKSIERSQKLAQALNAPCMHMGPSLVPEETSRALCRDVYMDNLVYAADALTEFGTKVLIEPMNTKDMPDALITQISEVLDLIDATNSDNLGLQFDFYHVYRNGLEIAAILAEVIHRVDHIQFSDSPGRCEPGGGDIDFQPGLDVIRKSGYAGWVGAEYRPTKATLDTLAWMEQF